MYELSISKTLEMEPISPFITQRVESLLPITERQTFDVRHHRLGLRTVLAIPHLSCLAFSLLLSRSRHIPLFLVLSHLLYTFNDKSIPPDVWILTEKPNLCMSSMTITGWKLFLCMHVSNRWNVLERRFWDSQSAYLIGCNNTRTAKNSNSECT